MVSYPFSYFLVWKSDKFLVDQVPANSTNRQRPFSGQRSQKSCYIDAEVWWEGSRSQIGVVWLRKYVNNIKTGNDEYRLNVTVEGLVPTTERDFFISTWEQNSHDNRWLNFSKIIIFWFNTDKPHNVLDFCYIIGHFGIGFVVPCLFCE